MLVKEWQAHEDMIVDISQIKDPFSFITCSKDKIIKIWTYQGDCLGEINTGSFSMNNGGPSNPWKFKFDWEKLKLEEITEVMRIYGNVSGSSLTSNDKFSSIMENLHTDDNIDEKKKNKKDKQEIAIVRKKRYKPLEETKKDKIFVNYNDDADVKFDVNKFISIYLFFQDQYIQELSKKLHRVVNPIPYETGLYEMGKQIFDKATKRQTENETSDFNYLNPSMGHNYSSMRAKKDIKPIAKRKEKEKSQAEKGKKYNAISRDNLQSEKYFTSLSGVCKKRGDEFLLPLINDK